MAFKLTAGNADDRKVAPDLITNIVGKLFGDKGYISQDLFEKLFDIPYIFLAPSDASITCVSM